MHIFVVNLTVAVRREGRELFPLPMPGALLLLWGMKLRYVNVVSDIFSKARIQGEVGLAKGSWLLMITTLPYKQVQCNSSTTTFAQIEQNQTEGTAYGELVTASMLLRSASTHSPIPLALCSPSSQKETPLGKVLSITGWGGI